MPGHTNTLTLEADKPGTFLGQCAEYCGLSHANMRFRVIAQTPRRLRAWVSEQQQGPRSRCSKATAPIEPGGPAQELIATKYQCTNCHTLRRLVEAELRPEPHAPRDRTAFAERHLRAEPARTSSKWVMNAPSMIPMQSEDCRAAAIAGHPCVGMPSFTENTPEGPADDDAAPTPNRSPTSCSE